MKALATVLTSEQETEHAAQLLKSEAFCNNPQLGLINEQIEACMTFVDTFIIESAALQELFNVFDVNASNACHDLFEGICK